MNGIWQTCNRIRPDCSWHSLVIIAAVNGIGGKLSATFNTINTSLK
jgi:hypothetical protein